jgi:hypothetical protein
MLHHNITMKTVQNSVPFLYFLRQLMSLLIPSHYCRGRLYPLLLHIDVLSIRHFIAMKGSSQENISQCLATFGAAPEGAVCGVGGVGSELPPYSAYPPSASQLVRDEVGAAQNILKAGQASLLSHSNLFFA